MSQDAMTKMECPECKHITHYTRKNKKKLKDRLELSMHCKFCKKHTMHKETK